MIGKLYSMTEHGRVSGSLIQNKSHETFWNPKIVNERHFKIIPKIEDSKMENIIEDLMAQKPLEK